MTQQNLVKAQPKANDLALGKYSPEQYNMLIPMQTVTNISEMHKPVLNTVQISTNPEDGEIYMQERAKAAWKDRPAQPAKFALTKKGLNKLARAAGIQIIKTESELPTVCQKCAQINRNIGKPVNCHSCGNKDVKYMAAISVPQLSGENQTYVAHKEIVVDDVTDGMSQAQAKEFMKFKNEMCETKALNRALRAAMQIKGTYTLAELEKPFVVAYLVPNLDHPEVRQEALKHFFVNSADLFGTEPKEIEPEQPAYQSGGMSQQVIELEDDDEVENESAPLIAEPEIVEHVVEQRPAQQPVQQTYYQQQQVMEQADDADLCTECHTRHCSPAEIAFSNKKYGRTICFSCQKKIGRN